jgi:Zn-finger nucleic acid-binding protein
LLDEVARMTTQSMPCPICGVDLEPTAGQHGIVWLCRACCAGAATLPILRQVAPRDFVNQVWQAALQNGVPSARVCPSCTQPFTTFTGSRAKIEPHLEVCTRCYWVWLDRESLSLLARTHGRPRALRRGSASATGAAAQGTLLQLAANVVRDALA